MVHRPLSPAVMRPSHTAATGRLPAAGRLLFAAAVAFASFAVPAVGKAQFSAAIVYDTGRKFDRSFNQAAWEGAERFRTETGVDYLEHQVEAPAGRERAFRALAKRGATVIVAVGFAHTAAVEKVARDYRGVRFALIDDEVDLPNVRSILFREHEGSFLVGMAAAMASGAGKIGFVGGMDVPLIRNFAAGYAEGARYIDSGIEIFVNMTGKTPAAWSDPARGAELARGQFNRGADVIYAAAGRTGLGVYRAAVEAGKLAIGVDSNQNYLHPGTMLTSMIKRVDVATYRAFKDAWQGTWTSGVRSLGLAEDGVDWALDEHNRGLVSAEMEARIEQARKDIVAGRIAVEGYRAQ